MNRKRVRALSLLDQGWTQAAAARALRVPQDQIRRWDDDAALYGERDYIADLFGLDPIVGVS